MSREIEEAVKRAGQSSIDHRDPTLADLSPEAIRARAEIQAQAHRTGQPDGGWTGDQLVKKAAEFLDIANRNMRIAKGRVGKRRARAESKADEALRAAAVCARLAGATPLQTGYLHALTLDKIQTCKAEVAKAFDQDAGALAVDTHRRIADQRARIRAEGAPAS